MTTAGRYWLLLTTAGALAAGLTLAHAQQEPQRGASSYMPVDIKEPFATTMARMKAAQPAIQKRQADLLAERYDLANRAAAGATMSRGKADPGGRAGQAAGRNDLGSAGQHEPGGDPRQEPLAGGILSAAASQSSGRRHGVPEVRDR